MRTFSARHGRFSLMNLMAGLAMLTLSTSIAAGGWIYRSERIAHLEQELASRSAELNRLIFVRDAENRKKPAESQTSQEELELAAVAAGSSEDQIGAPMGASANLSPADIDPKHLVSMANIVAGRKVAELVQTKSGAAIHYTDNQFGEERPIWHILDSVAQANAVQKIVITLRSKP